MTASDAAHRTRRSFGLLWRETALGHIAAPGQHLERAAQAAGLQLPTPAGTVLDAGCGDGADLNTLAELHPAATVVGIDINDHLEAAADAVASHRHAHVVTGSLLAPPLRRRSFGFVYSYGVIHHTDSPAGAFRALAELLAPGGTLLIYVYSDLREEPVMRAGLRLVTLLRRVTTRLPPRAVLLMARLLSPVAYLVFGLPAAALRRVPRGASVADKLPFNFVRRPGGAIGDLYDRFSAPLEHRHSRAEVVEWYRENGLVDVRVTSMTGARGWVGVGRRPQ